MQTDGNQLRLKNQVSFPIYLCSKEIIRKYTPLLKEMDLTYTQYIVMMYFWEKKKSNVKEISKILLLDSSTLTPLLKKLEGKGYITRARSTKDERNLVIEITETGKKLEDKAMSVPGKIEKCIDLSEKETAALYSLVNKVLNSIERNEIK